MKIRITKSSGNGVWYKRFVKRTFNVRWDTDEAYRVTDVGYENAALLVKILFWVMMLATTEIIIKFFKFVVGFTILVAFLGSCNTNNKPIVAPDGMV